MSFFEKLVVKNLYADFFSTCKQRQKNNDII